jgi:hypothetical protein
MRFEYKPRFESKPKPTTSASPGTLRLLAVAFTAGSLWFLYEALNPSPNYKAPPLISWVFVVICILTAMRLIELSTGEAGSGDWYGFPTFTAFSIMAWWMALSGDPSECTISGLFAFLIPHSVCRGVFIFGAAIFSLAPLFYGWRYFSRLFGD